MLTPKKGLDKIRADQAKKQAVKLHHEMRKNIAFEGHELSSEEVNDQIEFLIEKLLDDRKGLWND